eukprot:TRINITY_DN6444_c0_g1_i1.p1 TRINITY_DN6444_c0_g1~~TRINITY_DN6444_c0_g1_i1.p1  ORF type:complete len:171 (-),score=56.65 TRINITY_DN6444_c0_g1_i1:341-853(-)
MEPPWTVEQAMSDGVSKKELIEWLTEHADEAVKVRHKINKSALKKRSKDKAIKAYKDVLDPSRDIADVGTLPTESNQTEADQAAEKVKLIGVMINFIDMDQEERPQLELKLHPESTIAQVKDAIEAAEGIPAECCLLFNRRNPRMANDRTLFELRVEDKGTLHLQTREVE